MQAVLALFNQHNGQPAEVSTLARCAEEGCNQHMGAYSCRQGIEKDKELMAKPPAKIVHGSEEFDNNMAYSKKDMEYKPNNRSSIWLDSFEATFPEVAFSVMVYSFQEWSLDSQHDFREAILHVWDIAMRKFHGKLEEAHFDIASLVTKFLDHTGCFPKYLCALIHMATEGEDQFKIEGLQALMQLLNKPWTNSLEAYKAHS